MKGRRAGHRHPEERLTVSKKIDRILGVIDEALQAAAAPAAAEADNTFERFCTIGRTATDDDVDRDRTAPAVS